jgi:hypothetical protein
LREIISILQSERIQEAHLLVPYKNENSWSQVTKGKSSRSKQMTQQSSVSTSNRFSTLNEVTEETQQKKALSYSKKDNEDRPIPTVVNGVI